MRWHVDLVAVRLAGRFLATTAARRLIALTVALCAVVSYLDLGIGYRQKAFAGAALGAVVPACFNPVHPACAFTCIDPPHTCPAGTDPKGE